MSESMKEESAFTAKERIIDSVEAVVGSGHYTLEFRTDSPSVRILLTKSGYNWCTADYACETEYKTVKTGRERRIDFFLSKDSTATSLQWHPFW